MDLVVGRVVKPHGVRGELVVDVRTDEPELRFAPGTRVRGLLSRGKGAKNAEERRFTINAARNHSGRLLVSLDGVADRDAADELRGLLFVIDAADVDSGDDPNEFYDHELIGLPVRTVEGAAIGEVRDVIHLPASDLLAVTAAADGREILIPFVGEIVPTVSLDDGIVVDPPDGLLEE
ncbi:MAG: ribosome maturation factor RimM [Gordonia sp. (in: high G+C Gram-positive bacteria)]|uniref:ribosome maturation factor RimM n=1 Tax=Gordonia sp. (in: high G+C Gram-positive bacteria) TaxID=84139 RepID=UPI0039E32BAE